MGAVVHEEELNVVEVADDEGLVARGHHELGLLVGAEADLQRGKGSGLALSARPQKTSSGNRGTCDLDVPRA